MKLRLLLATCASSVVASSLALLLTASTAFGWHGGDQEVCWKVAAVIEASWSAEACDSVVGMCTTGTITPQFGMMSSTTSFTGTGLGGEPVGEASIVTPPAEPASTWSYSGELVITSFLGSLTIHDVGVFDTLAGLFTEMGRIVDGTGLFAGATGHLFISGPSNPTGFVGQIRGEICIDLGGLGWSDDD